MPVFDATATSEQVAEAFAPRVKGRTFVITGAGQPSIGSSMAIALARASPGHILIVSRTAAKVEPVLQLSEKSTLQSKRPSSKSTFVTMIRAGNMALKEYTVDKQGIEMQLSANHVGHFLLTNLLMPALLAAANTEHGARVVNLCSLGYFISPFRFDDYNFSGGTTYDLWTAYGQAKTANILFYFWLGETAPWRYSICRPSRIQS
ncbi:hypothetical protein DL766_009953 [Monosporascus sp. MC13-8B]|uniref:Ketoreductase (KR) domain-containing protein n=1 Tax=Monosporascus cannonballus TaxID=155416 RepID=A0ABY0H026_9PEZI|nr:hypothetical protein DL762_007119 [Monosporascus cannonballus]RYO88354.1 hypothetical protein DL763_006051 [Monosporascus cannonballus]RYP12450.1 hypothetical protein DL766_009953 [Monosporascus sp. MC13-8B]